MGGRARIMVDDLEAAVRAVRAHGGVGILLSLALALTLTLATSAEVASPPGPETVVVESGALKLHALLWRPAGPGPFPAVVFNHGSGTAADRESAHPATLGPVFSGHGYVFLYLFRRGSGLSADQGKSAAALLDREMAAHGQEARNALQLKLLEGDQLSDALAGLAFLRALPGIDKSRVALAGHSFGASLTLIMAERDRALCAAVSFSGSAGSWDKSPPLRSRLLAAVGRTTAPVFFIQAANDYSVAPAKALSAEMARLGKPYRVTTYPPVGRTAAEGHDFVYLNVGAWEPDVFDFLQGACAPKPAAAAEPEGARQAKADP